MYSHNMAAEGCMKTADSLHYSGLNPNPNANPNPKL